jgi:hypothetical protein
MTFLFADTTENGGNLDLEWERLRVRVPIQVDTKAQVMASIDKSIGDAWRPHFQSARYLLETNGDMDRALAYANTSISIKSTWWNNWVQAQILGKKGKGGEAVAAAEKAQSLGKDDPVYAFFEDDIAKSIGDWKKK